MCTLCCTDSLQSKLGHKWVALRQFLVGVRLNRTLPLVVLSPVLAWDRLPPCPDLGLGPPIEKDGSNLPQPGEEGWGYPQLGPDGVPPPSCEQTHRQTCENITFPHPLDAGGKDRKVARILQKVHDGSHTKC